MFRWTEGSKPEERTAALEALRSLKGLVPEIQQLAVEENLGMGPQAYDGLMEAEFMDEAAFHRYVENEDHQQVWIRQLQPVWADLAMIQVPG